MGRLVKAVFLSGESESGGLTFTLDCAEYGSKDDPSIYLWTAGLINKLSEPGLGSAGEGKSAGCKDGGEHMKRRTSFFEDILFNCDVTVRDCKRIGRPRGKRDAYVGMLIFLLQCVGW